MTYHFTLDPPRIKPPGEPDPLTTADPPPSSPPSPAHPPEPAAPGSVSPPRTPPGAAAIAEPGEDSELAAVSSREQWLRGQASGAYRFAIYTILGLVVGASIAAIEWVTIEVVLHRALHTHRWVQWLLPGLGLAIVAAIYRLRPGLTPSTSDDFIRAFHRDAGPDNKDLPPKLTSAMFTLGTGGALGLEGPAILTGSTFGRAISRLRPDALGPRGDRTLLVAGAAAAVAAVFKAPATGVLFALETPYRRDIARHALVPALISSAAAYITFVVLLGDHPLLDFAPAQITLRDELLGAVGLGLLGGGAARVLVTFFKRAKHLDDHLPLTARLPLAAVAIGLCVWATDSIAGTPLALGPGAEMTAEVVSETNLTVLALIALFALRALATGAALGAGGVGGVFIPLVVQGLLLGRIFETAFGVPSTGLYPVVGLAAVLGAGYRTPLAAVVFVAESTGRAEFVIPALIATAISQAVMGDAGISEGQVNERTGQLERRLQSRAINVAVTEMGAIGPETTLLEVVDRFGVHPAAPAVPVCTDESYVGLLVLHDVAAAILEHGIDATCGEAMRDVPAVADEDSAIEAARIMNDNDTAAVAVLDQAGRPCGVVSAMSLAGLPELD